MTCSASEVFCDHLTASYKPEETGDLKNSPADEVIKFLNDTFSVGVEYAKSYIDLRLITCAVEGYKPTTGLVHIQERNNCTTISTSGRFLKELRDMGVYGEYLNILSSKPYSITRLDASKDYYLDAAPILKALRRVYPREIHLTNKPIKTAWYMGTREDGAESGTFYGGLRSKARVTCAVYDKSKERFDKAGEIIPSTTRYEMRFRGKDLGMTLKDAYDPEQLFWEYAKPLNIKPDTHVNQWQPHGFYSQWVGDKKEPLTDAMKLQRLLDYSSDVQKFLVHVDACGEYGLNLLHAKLQALSVARVGGSPRKADTCSPGESSLLN